jgi:hypothetical protein
MTVYTFTYASRNLIIGRSSLYLTGDDLATRDLVYSRVDSQGRVSTKSYSLVSKNLLLANVPSVGRLSNQTFSHTSRSLVLERAVLGGVVSSARQFPEVVPTTLQYKPSKHVVTEHPAQSGEVESHIWSDSKAGASLQLEYINISDTVAERFMALWDSVSGTYGSLRLSNKVLSGVKQELVTQILQNKDSLKWFFAKVPEWQGRVKGYGDLKISLVSSIVSVTGAVGGYVPFAAVQSENSNVPSFNDCDYIGRGPDEPIGPAPAPLWVSSISATNTLTFLSGYIDWGLYGNSYQIVKIQVSGAFKLLLVKRDRSGNVLWQRLSNINNEDYFTARVFTLANGNVLVTLHAYAGNSTLPGPCTLLLFNSGGTLLRSIKFLAGGQYGIISNARVKNSSTLVIVGMDNYYAGANIRVGIVDISNSSIFGTVSTFREYRPSTYLGSAWDIPDFRILPSGEIAICHVTYGRYDLSNYVVIKLSPDLTTINATAVMTQNTGWIVDFIAMSDGSYRMTTSSRHIIKLTPLLQVEWIKAMGFYLHGPFGAILDSNDNIYMAATDAGGLTPEPYGWRDASTDGWLDGTIYKIDKDANTIFFCTYSSLNSYNAWEYSYTGNMSGLDLQYGKFIACHVAGHRVISHNIEMLATTTSVIAPPGASGQKARAGTNFANRATASPTLSAQNVTPPTFSNAELYVSYTSISWSFSDPGSSISWDLTSVG